MDALKNKTYNQFDYISRYTSVPYYYNILDNKYIYGLSKQLDKNTTYVSHKVKQTDTLDSLSLKYYNNPTYYWVIAYYNDIQDAFIDLSENYSVIKIPNIGSIDFEDPR